MGLVVRAIAIYVILMVLMRASGKRQFSELTAFDAILLLIISEAVQQALLGDEDFSLTAGVILIVTLVSIDILMSHIKQWWTKADLVLEGAPVLLLDDGELIDRAMDRERVDESDILAAARETFGIESLDEIRYAILERTGSISIIPRQPVAASAVPAREDA
ncbi:MAG TPA: YetF domain-containing protein [Dehalococcoidia bacterium]|nr:YetF domain-containing protein [Dehalococcoidia bacterium]